MSLSQKVQEVEAVFLHLDQEIGKFQGWSKLGCKTGCGKCCNKPDIEATVLEFLPFAHYLYLHDQAFEWLSRIPEDPGTVCLLFEATPTGSGSCAQYIFRGLICRLFGFSARTDKYAQRELVTCQVIKTEQPIEFTETVKHIHVEGSVPVINHYYMRMHAIDRELARDFYPINEAIRRAIETVLQYYAYRK